jgi:hypothetical protein
MPLIQPSCLLEKKCLRHLIAGGTVRLLVKTKLGALWGAAYSSAPANISTQYFLFWKIYAQFRSLVFEDFDITFHRARSFAAFQSA